MGRTQKKQPGLRNYINYTTETLKECLQSIRSGQLSQRKASKHFGIARSTIKNKLKRSHEKTVGRPCVFTLDEENAFEQHLIKMCDFGFPLTEIDFRMIIRSYLNKRGIRVHKFKDNLPGYDWAKLFLKRHPNISLRIAANIKKVRAQVGEDLINEYMDNLSTELQNIPPSRIWNYDETNLTDDPGNRKVLCKRGSKYVEKICNFSKNATSLMFCGNADGKCLPPYIVYKAEHMWSTWTANGPERARYNRSKSGWFDLVTFEDWFEFHFLPAIKHEDGPVVLIGDNLSSHMSVKVLQLCEERNIRFVCLPPNTTHLTQPLDVAFFAPMKRLWRSILTQWKESKSGSKYTTIPKDIFPSLLRELWEQLQENAEKNLKAGFTKCGIYPLDRQMLLRRLPQQLHESARDGIGESFLEQLEKKREAYLGQDSTRKKRKKVTVAPGKSIVASDLENVSQPGPSKSTSKRKRATVSDSSEEEEDIVMELASDSDLSETFSDLGVNPTSVSSTSNDVATPLPKSAFKIDDFVIVLFNKQRYPGKITAISDDGATVSCLEKGIKFWKWPKKQDILLYKWGDVLNKINQPRMISQRNQFFVPELDTSV